MFSLKILSLNRSKPHFHWFPDISTRCSYRAASLTSKFCLTSKSQCHLDSLLLLPNHHQVYWSNIFYIYFSFPISPSQILLTSHWVITIVSYMGSLTPPRLTSCFHWIRSLAHIKKQNPQKNMCFWVPTESSLNSSHGHPRPFNDGPLFYFSSPFSPASAFYLSQTELLNVSWANLLVLALDLYIQSLTNLQDWWNLSLSKAILSNFFLLCHVWHGSPIFLSFRGWNFLQKD